MNAQGELGAELSYNRSIAPGLPAGGSLLMAVMRVASLLRWGEAHMKSLLILRHGEAAASTAGMCDEQRPLTEHGESQAHALGRWLLQHGFNPGSIVCSAAVRARQTAELVAAAAHWHAPVTALETLYNASGEALIAHVRAQAATVSQLLVVAHAPGVTDAVRLTCAKRADVTLVYEPATLAEIVLDIEQWSALAHGIGALRLLLPA